MYIVNTNCIQNVYKINTNIYAAAYTGRKA